MIRCRRYRRHLPLLVGGDLDERLALRVRLHVRNCPGCAAAAEALRCAHRALQESACEPVPIRDASLWPGLRPLCRAERSGPSAWRGWLPTAGLAAACVAATGGIVLLPQAPPPPDGDAAQFQGASPFRTWSDPRVIDPPTRTIDRFIADSDRHLLLPEAKLVSEKRGSF